MKYVINRLLLENGNYIHSFIQLLRDLNAKTFLEDFMEIMKRTLQNFENLEDMFLLYYRMA